MPPVEVGETYTESRTFTPDDVDQFAAVSGDDQARHTEADERGRRMVQGLLTASLLTSIGGDLEVLASRMELHFRRPVYTGETLVCEMTIASVEPRADGSVDLVGDVTVRRTDQASDVAAGARASAPADGDSDGDDDNNGDRDTTGAAVLEATVDGIIRE